MTKITFFFFSTTPSLVFGAMKLSFWLCKLNELYVDGVIETKSSLKGMLLSQDAAQEEEAKRILWELEVKAYSTNKNNIIINAVRDKEMETEESSQKNDRENYERRRVYEKAVREELEDDFELPEISDVGSMQDYAMYEYAEAENKDSHEDYCSTDNELGSIKEIRITGKEYEELVLELENKVFLLEHKFPTF